MLFRLLCLILWTWSPVAVSDAGAQQATGRITGSVVDEKTGDPMIGATVQVEGLNAGAMVDLEGKYLLRHVPAGSHTLVVSMIGYAQKKITGVAVGTDKTTKIDVTLQEQILETEVIEVTAKSVENTEAALLKARQNALSISDAISAEDISRGGQSDAAGAMSRVTGASVVDGKYVFIRGLGERYSSAQLNGAQLPSADPNRKSVQMDMFSSNLLDNIVTEKTFTPDKPGNFSGGSVNIKTKAFPEAFTMSFSTSTRFNTKNTFKNMLSYQGGGKDFFGVDDGTRAIPDPLKDPEVVIPTITSAQRDPAIAQTLDALSKSFNGVMTPTLKNASIGQSYAYSVGTQMPLFDRPLGVLGSLSFSRDVSAYNDGVSGIWKRLSSDAQALSKERLANDVRGTEEALWGGLLNLTYRPEATHEIGVNILYNRSGEKSARLVRGEWPAQIPDEGARYETRVLSFTEREMRSTQFRGKHVFETLGHTEVEWTGSLISSKQDEPDLRFFTNGFAVNEENGAVVDTIPDSYRIQTSNYAAPTRYFRNLDEKNKDVSLHIALPFRQWSGLTSRIKFGGAYLYKTHTFRERRFEIRQDRSRYQNNPDFFFSNENMGILPPEQQTSPRFIRFGNYVRESTDVRSNYDGEQKISAGYLMIDLPLFRRLRLIGGTRLEVTRLDVASLDSTLSPGKLDNRDWLPSVNLVYQVSGTMNVRGAFSRTLARPTFRELAPYASFEFVGDFIFVGNANLKRTLIENYDFRWEWFTRPGEIYAVSYFYKQFQHPIERVIVTTNGEIQFQNVDEATVTGVELEWRRKLDALHRWLANFQVGGNLSFIASRVHIAPAELALIRSLDPAHPGTRELQGQSPYVLNLDGMYDNTGTGTLLSLHYNVFGRRLSEVSTGGTPDVFEKPVHMLDLTASQRLWKHTTFKLSVKNILDPAIVKFHPFNGQEFMRSKYRMGRTVSFGLSYGV
jgi:TonB-dependent receptor